MKARPVLVGTALALCAGAAIAQPLVSSSASVIVTATRTPRTADDALAAVSVITREDIERRQPQDLVDLLRTEAGIDLTRAGGPGGNVSLFMRGTDSNHVLVLVDGVRVASASTGAFEWRSLPTAQIERIEIVRGPRASLYGSDAIGGVIHIFTRRPAGPEAALGTGSHGTRTAEAGWGGGGAIRGFVTGAHNEAEGFSAQNERGFSFDPDDDGLRQQSVSAGLEAELGQRIRAEILGWQSRGWTEFDVGRSSLLNEALKARVSQPLSTSWSHSLSVAAVIDRLETASPFFASRFTTRRKMIDWQNDIVVGRAGLLTAGLSYVGETGQNLDLSSATTVFDRAQYNRAAFALWQSRFGENDLQLAARHDDYASFGGHSTGSVALGRALTLRSRGWISYGTAFHAPSLNELFHPGFGGLFAGNPDLDPERSRTLEIGARHRFDPDQTLGIAVHSTRIDDLIAFEGPNSQAVNVDEASIRGMELEHALARGPWKWTNILTLQRAQNEITDERLVSRPDAKFSTLLQRNFGRNLLGAEIMLSSDRRDVSGRELPGYGLVNLAARYVLYRYLTLEGRVENLFDKEYELIEGFNTPGRSIFVTLRYRP